MKEVKRSKLIFGLAGSLCIGGLAGLLLLNKKRQSAEAANVEIRRKEEMPSMPVPGKENKNDVVLKTNKKTLTDRERDELIRRTKAMTREELEIMLEAVPVELCMKRIQAALDYAREFESMIKKAYEMKQ